MVVDKYVGRCLDVGSTPTGSIIPLHSFAFLGKTLLNQRFLFLSLVFLGILLRKRIQQRSHKKEANLLKNQYNLQSILRFEYSSACLSKYRIFCSYFPNWISNCFLSEKFKILIPYSCKAI